MKPKRGTIPKRPRSIGPAVARLRRARRLRQKELAARAKISVPYLCRLERGHKVNPSLDVALRLAKALEVEPAELLE